jgi:hypothetical protein
MKTAKSIVALLVFVAMVAMGCSKDEGQKDGQKAGSSASEKANSVIKVVKDIGPAGKVVQSFFKNWEFRRFKQMQAQTVHSRDEDFFVEQMEKTPIQWRNLSILAERESGDDREVDISLEVTDIPCAFAACMVNLRSPQKDKAGKLAFWLTPESLEIQSFMPVKQTWLLVKLDEKYFIDVCAAGSKKKRHENVMNYVLDASDLEFLPFDALGGSDENKLMTAASAWLAGVFLNMNIPVEESKDVIAKSKPLFDKAQVNMKDLVDSVKSIRGKTKSDDDQPAVPAAKESDTKKKHTVDQPEAACTFFEKYMHVIRNRQSLEKGSTKTLTDEDRASLAEWFVGADFGDMSEMRKKDCEDLRDALVKFLTNLEKDGFSAGQEQARLSQKMFLFLVSFELSGEVASISGHPELADFIDAHTALAKMLLMLKSKVVPDKAEVRPSVKLFAEYFIIYTDLFGSLIDKKIRPVLGQTALLSMRPGKLDDPKERRLFTSMHDGLRAMSLAISDGRSSAMGAGQAMASVGAVMNGLNITQEELEKATSKGFSEIAEKMRKLSDKPETEKK